VFERHHESSALVAAPVERVFAHLDDHSRLSAHMSSSSWMMGGGSMSVEVDEGGGRKVGSRIRLAGTACGVALSVEEIVTEHQPPYAKKWETIGTPRLLVIGPYRMGFELWPRGEQARLRVFIDYELPTGLVGHWLGRLVGGLYASWCTQQMVKDAVRFFSMGKPPGAPVAHDVPSIRRP
jgi:polyketide cyclase/dehydrase/lipid transport protein